ncbi:MAG: hypothetical protein ACT4PV_02880 [Planctomycetaceae bacterium]
MRTTLLLPLLGLAAAAGLPRASAQEQADLGAARLFASRCASCHTVPDPSLRTDRAWLDQVNRTS